MAREFLTALLFFAAAAGSAQARETVTSKMEAFVVQTDAGGKESFRTATASKPGDVIEYRIRYDNNGNEPVSQLAVNGPVPVGTHYVVGSAKSETRNELLFSIDGGKSWQKSPVKRRKQRADGPASEELVAAEEYTNIEWRAAEPLRPGVVQQFVYRVRVIAEKQ